MEHWAVASCKREKARGGAERTGLPTIVEFAKGMEVMVTFNVEADLDVTNGAHGHIVHIVLDENEPPIAEGADVVHLQYMLAYLLVQLDRTKVELPGLPKGVIPLQTLTKSFNIKRPNAGTGHQSLRIHRRQLPLTASYAFTDMRSQGQTISHVIVDIGGPSGGRMTTFNAYVALSRSLGRDTIRLLRDFDERLFTELPR